MLTLNCPNCGLDKDETELGYGGEAHLKRHGAGSSEAELEQYLFTRENPKGVHFERWRCAAGCSKWFHAARCTVTMQVFGTYSAQTYEPPQAIKDAISAERPGWSWREFK